MKIERAHIERELAAVRAQMQQAANVLQQAAGAEKALLSVLTMLDMDEAETPATPPSGAVDRLQRTAAQIAAGNSDRADRRSKANGAAK